MNIEVIKIRKTDNSTQLTLKNGKTLQLRPFIYIKEGDTIEILPDIDNFKEINKVFIERGKKQITKIRIFPPYEKEQQIIIPPHRFRVIFRERRNSKDWEQIKELEQFHYRGKGLNKLVGRRTVLLADMLGHGVVGFGVLSATLGAANPRFKFLRTNFKEQMKSKLINKLVRIPRIVIHPEFRGMNLGVLMAKNLVNYARHYWDINYFTPIMVEVIAAMTEYHKFFEKAGFFEIGRTLGYKNGIIPNYGNGSFLSRTNYESYDFMQNQKSKPYLIFPLVPSLTKRAKKVHTNKLQNLEFGWKSPKLTRQIKIKKITVRYKVRSMITKRTNIVKEVFGVESENAFSPVLRNITFCIDPGDVILITGASGSGKSTLIRLLTTKLSQLRKNMDILGNIIGKNLNKIAILNSNWDSNVSLIDQIRKKNDINKAIEILNSVGLSEAHLYMRNPLQISDGQKYRFAIAKLCDSGKQIWVADEFVSTLNPEMGAIVAKGIRKRAFKNGATLILAAPHIDNFIGSLLPNKLVKLSWGAEPRIYGLKLINFSQNQREISLQIKNNGVLPLRNIKIGITEVNGYFKPYFIYPVLEPNNKISTKMKIKKSKYLSTFVISTDEGVGDILYLN
ncbi:MAG: ATP-binding cassette domain-containing protein [Candidatus Hodarchaeota archaeon]